MIWYLSSWIAGTTIRLTQTYAPTIIVGRFIRTRQGQNWGLPIAAALVPTYALTFNRVAEPAIATHNGWLYVLAFLVLWNTGKMVALASGFRGRGGAGSCR